MTRNQRRMHATLWTVFGPALLIALILLAAMHPGHKERDSPARQYGASR
jgi:hypothetical protein